MTAPGIEDRLLEMKDTSELMVDLAYSALLYQNEEIARQVVDLEDRVDAWEEEIKRKAIARAIEDGDVEKALVFVRLADSIENIADGALQIADVVLRDIELHPIVTEALRESDTTITALPVPPDSPASDRSLGDLRLASETGCWVIALRRDGEWVYGPDEHTVLQAEDFLIVRGPVEGERELRAFLGE